MESFGFPLEAIIILAVMVLFSMFIDLRSHSDRHEITFKDAIKWSVFFIAVSLLFYGYLYFRFDQEYANLFLTGYVLEKSLSADNMLVIMGIMASFGITSGYMQHRILYLGILGAIIFKGLFIGAGSALFALGPVVQMLFGLFVIWTAWLMLKGEDDDDDDVDYTQHWSVRYIKNHFPVAQGLIDDKFFVTKQQAEDAGVPVEVHGNWFSKMVLGGKYATVAFLCLICIEISDVAFSFDSIPVILAITKDPLLVYSSIIFATLGLRSMYFVLKVAIRYLVHLDKAVGIILVYVGGKLMLPALHQYIPGIPEIHIHHLTSLYIVLSLLRMGVIVSLLFPGKEEAEV